MRFTCERERKRIRRSELLLVVFFCSDNATLLNFAKSRCSALKDAGKRNDILSSAKIIYRRRIPTTTILVSLTGSV